MFFEGKIVEVQTMTSLNGQCDCGLTAIITTENVWVDSWSLKSFIWIPSSCCSFYWALGPVRSLSNL